MRGKAARLVRATWSFARWAARSGERVCPTSHLRMSGRCITCRAEV